MKKTPNPKFFMFLTAIAIIAGVCLSLWQYSGLQDTESRVAKLQKNALNQAELENRLKDSLTKLQQCSASLNHLEKGVPELDYVPTMLKQLQDVGTESGLQVLGVRPVVNNGPANNQKGDKPDKKVPKGYQAQDIEVTCLGSYKAVSNFVQAMQTFPKVVAARTLSLSPKNDSKDKGGPPVLEATISLRTYLFPSDKSDMKQALPDGSVGNEEATPNAS